MDLSLRTYVHGWKAIFLRDVNVLNEVSRLLGKQSLTEFNRVSWLRLARMDGACVCCLILP